MAQEMDMVQKAGASTFRLPISPEWSEKGAVEWEWYDEIFRAAAEHGVTILPHFQGRMNGEDDLPTVGEKVAWSEWAKVAVRRYGYNGTFWSQYPSVPARPVFAWEMLNEPNNNSFMNITGTEYGEFLQWAGPAVQTASESWGGQKTGVLFGGLLAWSGGTEWQKFFLNAYNVPGAESAFTGLAIHPYELDTSKFPGETRIQAFTKAVSGARTFLNSNGAAGKSLWITEVGWPAEFEWGVSEPEQANLLKEAVGWAKTAAASLDLKALIWYNQRDIGVSTWQYRCGLRREDGSFRSSWFAYQEQTGAEVWPTWSNHNLGGSITGDPAISSAAPEQLELFARGGDGALWHRHWDGATWSGWVNLGGALASDSGPGTVSWSSNRVDVVYRGTDNGVWQRAWGEGSNGGVPISLGGYTLSDPAISSKGKGQLQVFVRGVDNALWTKSFSNGSWSGWETLGGQITSGPSAVSWSNNRTDVVARGTDNGVWHWYWDGSWHLESIGGSVTSDPAISTLGTGTLDVFAKGGDNRLWHQSFHDSTWWGWESLGTTITSGPGAVSWGSQRTDVVARAANWSVQHWWWSP